ncbi:DUF1194 domain-containing protein [Phreatobacter stygius]|uniref:DUF1194 domain-containing protein n=1 Tax=Phreatobacter stygius TaxID=1940610 RepID=A0A4D7BNA2_9HYPH|nr:DUF1194 domain-containing protein [Phreatobacter stygius]QCI69337.1 DUF1194 domain-containing protein [Phreatobacter stygius]
MHLVSRRLALGLAAIAAVVVRPRGARGQPLEPVDVELVLAADGSGSIDDDELRLQRQGYAEALVSADVLTAIRSGTIGAIAVVYVEWGGPHSQHVIADWQVIRDAATARAFGDQLTATPRAARGYNSISAAIDFSVGLIEANAYRGLRRVIDVSGDGPHIGGRPVEAARDDAVAKGMVINALAILRPGGSIAARAGQPLADHYREAVIGGPGAFVEIADESRSFAEAVRRKIVNEIA